MKIFSAPGLRNVAVVGHNTVGKTTLVAAMLHASGATTRPGRIEDGTCPTDFDGEELERQISINLAVAHAIHRDVRVNFVDAPGYGIFSPEAYSAVAAADSVLIVLDAVSGVEVQTDKAWKFAAEFGRPVMFVINRMDRERASFERVMEALRRKFGRGVVPLQIPVGEEKAFKGTVDLVRMESHFHEGGQRVDGAIPEDLAARAAEEHEKLAARKLFPVFCTSSSQSIGVRRVLDACATLLPSPEGTKVTGVGKDGKPLEVVTDEKGHAIAQVFKTVSDPFAGRISYLRVRSGHFQSDGTYWNASKGV